jgi:Sec-independent protein translocase protein TatA
MMFLFLDISTGEIFFVFLVILLLFGPESLPNIARTLGRFFNKSRQVTSEIQQEFMAGAQKMSQEVQRQRNEIAKSLEKAIEPTQTNDTVDDKPQDKP